MKATGLKTVFLAIGLVAAMGLATHVSAARGYGKGTGGAKGYERGWNCRGLGFRGGLSQEDAAKLDSGRRAFFESTSELRQSIRQKNLELRSELAKEEIDAARARALQTDISNLRAELDQKRLEHRIEKQGDVPEWCRGQGRGRGMGRRGGCW